MSERIEIRTLTDGGQQPPEVARLVATFLDAAERTDPGPDAPQVRDPGQPLRLDRLRQLDGRFLVAAGERDCNRALGRDREGVRPRLRPALGYRRRRADRLRRP